jgi:hypothetical protein
VPGKNTLMAFSEKEIKGTYLSKDIYLILISAPLGFAYLPIGGSLLGRWFDV